MARYAYLIFLVSLLLGSCAQVGVITGGEKDTAAPKPIDEKVTPPNASTHFLGNQIVMPFDEYFTLSSPATSIQIVPPHATIKASVDKKTLTLSWEETLRPNTTYAIYLNNTVKDLSEKNDSIMQYVFSTGASLDSTNFSATVVDAFTNSPISEAVVALYDPVTKVLVNFAQTDRSGRANLNYLRTGSYELIAFKDENNDLVAQASEQVGFLSDSIISIDSSGTMLTPIRLFSPEPTPEILSVKFESPASFLIETNVTLETPSVSIDGSEIAPSNYLLEEPTKLRVFVDPTNMTSGKISLSTNVISDTATYRILEAQKKGAIRITPSKTNGIFSPTQRPSFQLNDVIQSVDTSLMHFTKESDSSAVYPIISYANSTLSLGIEHGATQQIRVEFEPGAITTSTGVSPRYNGLITLNSSKKYGTISLDVSSYTTPILIQLIKGTKIVQEIISHPSEGRIILSELEPGDYTFRIVRDENNNGKWDTGNLETRALPEQIDQFSKATTVRANWEIEVELVPIEAAP